MRRAKSGCLKNFFATFGGVAFLLVTGTLAWQYRAQVRDAYRAFRGDAVVEMEIDSGPGMPSADALESARQKQRRMARPGGPDAVTLNAAEMASLIVDGLDPIGRSALDSLTVQFANDRFAMEAQLVTEIWGREQLGFFSGLLQAREPLRVAGPARIERAGVVAWEPDELSVRSLPFPPAAIRPIVNALTGGSNGTILLAAPTTVGEIQIRPGGITFYRQDR